MFNYHSALDGMGTKKLCHFVEKGRLLLWPYALELILLQRQLN